jgi:hypothetical protein
MADSKGCKVLSVAAAAAALLFGSNVSGNTPFQGLIGRARASSADVLVSKASPGPAPLVLTNGNSLAYALTAQHDSHSSHSSHDSHSSHASHSSHSSHSSGL